MSDANAPPEALKKKALEGTTVLVTGASGFIGWRLVRVLAKQGADVHGVGRGSPPSSIPGIRWHSGDLADSEFTRHLFRSVGPEVVFHLAGQVTGSRDLSQVIPTFRGNLLSTIHILEESTEASCQRIVLAGSMEEPDCTESSFATPGSPYAAAKWASSSYARMFHALYQTPVALARIFMVYGPGQRDARKLIPYVITSLLQGKRPEVGSGRRPVDWIFVDDVVAGLVAMGSGLGPLAIPVDLGSGVLVTIRSVVEQIEGILGLEGASRFGAIPDRPLERVGRADPESSFQHLGWKAGTDLGEGLGSTVDWFRRQGVADWDGGA